MKPKIFNDVPWEMVMPVFAQNFFIVLNALILIVAIVFFFMEMRRRQDNVPLFLLIGAGLAIFYEPLGDTLASAYYPEIGQLVWIDAAGRKIPVFIGLLYFWYMAVPPLLFMRAMEKGITQPKLWVSFIGAIIFAIGYEVLGVAMGAWTYYGLQPYRIMNVPVWAPVTYAGFCYILCVGSNALVAGFDRKYHCLLILAVPLLLAGGHCALSMPTIVAMFSDLENQLFWNYVGATSSILLSFGVVWLIGLVYCKPHIIDELG